MKTLGTFVKCAVTVCEKAAKYRPEVRFGAINLVPKIAPNTYYPWKPMAIAFCRDHSKLITVTDLFPLKEWSAVCQGFKDQKMKAPNWELTKVRYVRL